MSTVDAASLNTDETSFNSEPALISDSYLPYYEGWSGQKLKLKRGHMLHLLRKPKRKRIEKMHKLQTAC